MGIITTACNIGVISALAFASAVSAQTIMEKPLPVPIVSKECVIGDDPFFGWDGEQSCIRTNIWFYEATYPLSQISSDINGDNLAWDRIDFLNKTVRCDVFDLTYQTESGYEVATYDITFLDKSNPVVDPDVARLPVSTSHIYNSNWRISAGGQLENTLLNFNSGEYTTEQGYLFIYESQSVFNQPDKFIANRFGHCYLRDGSMPLRASKYCVDYDGDGIGWNGTENCTLQTTSPTCDYSQALLGSNQGWGYDTVTGRSCPPLPDSVYIPEDKCNWPDENGWGWNEFRQESCNIN